MDASNRIMEVLLRNQEPSKFIQEVCMISLSQIENQHIFLLNQIFVDILRQRMTEKNMQLSQTLLGSKNKKKKNKKK